MYLATPGSTIDAQLLWMELTFGVMILSIVLNVLITVPFALSFYLLADFSGKEVFHAVNEAVHHSENLLLPFDNGK